MQVPTSNITAYRRQYRNGNAQIHVDALCHQDTTIPQHRSDRIFVQPCETAQGSFQNDFTSSRFDQENHPRNYNQRRTSQGGNEWFV